jgi:hypothetical protein
MNPNTYGGGVEAEILISKFGRIEKTRILSYGARM